ncbi:MBL fold metallo-hydrolase [Xanthomonas nasturtii]|uniref:MBL fold metallo-hydrolase n=1 Tax=Xanthomonas nasturtii TaxID=1843581 RepID=A0A3E1KSY8_9XANT|nr:MBL fold metallo-hydrolase [Xanthomonas nasturtii]MCL1500651.1 MBL fold metallo-hydrolase [Xanthomonas nasturtii]MCL1504408.1 MBL fold metallo-hydrolase [Xanthomonas nasturtii]MCL1523951.1 MBL fold metallo-hydrolase [Xanthomonas nasturtii]MCL1529735.1 MBL fold metallo-hydrolase [Xanthomonas nasturtii]MCL1564646.1 MBL fold metallo-hydrolase [Xanthomonas nasturtii]
MTALADPGIHTIDTGFGGVQFDAAYLIVEAQRGAFVDCGTSLSVPHMLAAVQAAGLTPAQVEWLVLTHVHLDHAGGAGALLQHLPNARVLVHPRGAPHLIDPTRLIAGATAVYGEAEMARSYGVIVPVPAERVVQASDGDTVMLGARALHTIDTPGHARHHLCVWDARSRSWFTGDTFGLSYRQLDSAAGAFILPTSSPVQFEPEAMLQSIARLMETAPEAMYLTHYGRVAPPAPLARALGEQIHAMTDIALGCAQRPDRHRCMVAALTALYLERARQHGCRLDDAAVEQLLATDIELNAQGLGCWLDRATRAN